MILFLLILLSAVNAYGTPTAKHIFAFYRDMTDVADRFGTRRIFGGNQANINEFPYVCALLTRDKVTKCSGSVINFRFVLTAAHCIDTKLRYVLYNARTSKSGDHVDIQKLYRHPGFNLMQADEGDGTDVVQLYHDVGMVETKSNMFIAFPANLRDPMGNLMKLPKDFSNLEILVLGFGRSVNTNVSEGEELMSVKLRTVSCERPTWIVCHCGTSRSGEESRGVCTGDSGGPVLLEDVLIGITSMGPVECVTSPRVYPGATIVYTLIRTYIDLINATINHDLKKSMPVVALSMSCGNNACAPIFILLFSLTLCGIYKY